MCERDGGGVLGGEEEEEEEEEGPLTPAMRACVRQQPAAERRLIQKRKLRGRSYHHPDDIGACLLPSDINRHVLPSCFRAGGIYQSLMLHLT